MKKIIETIQKDGLGVPVIIGGAPVSSDFADQVNANGYGDNAPLVYIGKMDTFQMRVVYKACGRSCNNAVERGGAGVYETAVGMA